MVLSASEPPDLVAPDKSRAARSHPRRRGILLIVFLSIAAVIAAIVAAGIGQVSIPPLEVLGSVLNRIGIDIGAMPSHPQGESTLWIVRFPRVILALLVGAALATAGGLMQGVFGNPLAEPSIIGVSAGSAVGAATVIVVGGALVSGWSIAGAAFLAGLATTFLVYALSRSGGRTEVVTLVLTGVAVNAVASALLALLTFMASTAAREQIVFWQLGSLNGATWQQVAIVAPLALAGIGASIVIARKIDLLSLGERAARHLGVNVEQLRIIAVVLVAVMTASGVAFTGIIAFVGLVVPHLVRMIAGPGHRILLPASAVGGALVLVLADLVARTLVENADLPLGMLTSLVGGPFFFYLLRRTRARQGGWA